MVPARGTKRAVEVTFSRAFGLFFSFSVKLNVLTTASFFFVSPLFSLIILLLYISCSQEPLHTLQ